MEEHAHVLHPSLLHIPLHVPVQNNSQRINTEQTSLSKPVPPPKHGSQTKGSNSCPAAATKSGAAAQMQPGFHISCCKARSCNKALCALHIAAPPPIPPLPCLGYFRSQAATQIPKQHTHTHTYTSPRQTHTTHYHAASCCAAAPPAPHQQAAHTTPH